MKTLRTLHFLVAGMAAGALFTGFPAAASETVKITPLGSQNGEFCVSTGP